MDGLGQRNDCDNNSITSDRNTDFKMAYKQINCYKLASTIYSIYIVNGVCYHYIAFDTRKYICLHIPHWHTIYNFTLYGLLHRKGMKEVLEALEHMTVSVPLPVLLNAVVPTAKGCTSTVKQVIYEAKKITLPDVFTFSATVNCNSRITGRVFYFCRKRVSSNSMEYTK